MLFIMIWINYLYRFCRLQPKPLPSISRWWFYYYNFCNTNDFVECRNTAKGLFSLVNILFSIFPSDVTTAWHQTVRGGYRTWDLWLKSHSSNHWSWGESYILVERFSGLSGSELHKFKFLIYNSAIGIYSTSSYIFWSQKIFLFWSQKIHIYVYELNVVYWSSDNKGHQPLFYWNKEFFIYFYTFFSYKVNAALCDKVLAKYPELILQIQKVFERYR